MDILFNRIRPRHLVIGAMGMIMLKYSMVTITGLTPPSFNAGWERSPGVERQASFRLSQRDLLSIERNLSPPPVLSWSRRVELAGLPKVPDVPGEVAVPELDIPEPKGAPGAIRVEPLYLRTLPDLSALPSAERKQRFIALLLPLVLRANEELEARRELVLESVINNDLEKLKLWGQLYGYTPANGTVADYERELLRRIAPVPVSIAMAQAAVESGWGTSRFAIHGNALMGQWGWGRDAGIRPKDARHDDMVIRAFASLFDSVRAYMHNLNSHPAYAAFRETRNGNPQEIKAHEVTLLVNQLENYSEKGHEYTDTLKTVIQANNLLVYDKAELLEN